MRPRSAVTLIAALTCGATASVALAARTEPGAPNAASRTARVAHAASDRAGSWGGSSTTAGKAGAAAKGGATVHVVHTSAGSILVDSSGDTLYLFTADAKNSDRCVKVSGCIKAWPPLIASGKPTAGSGAKASLLGTIPITGGHKQVTYAGHPLYTFTEDSGPASTGYIGASSFGGTWYAVSATGGAVR